MAWYEHKHDHETCIQPAVETQDMTTLQRFTLRLSNLLGIEHGVLYSGESSAALHAAWLLFSPELGERKLMAGDEILLISAFDAAACKDIASLGGVPVHVPIDPVTCTVNERDLEAALSPATRAVWVEHLPGCVINLITVRDFCNKYDLWMIENIAETLGSFYAVGDRTYAVGSIGDWCSCSLRILGVPASMLLTRDTFLATLCRQKSDPYSPETDGDLEKSLLTGCEKLQLLPQTVKQCRARRDFLAEALLPCGEQVILPRSAAHAQPSCLGVPLLCEGSCAINVLSALQSNGVAIRLWSSLSEKSGNVYQKNGHDSTKVVAVVDLVRANDVTCAAAAVREVLRRD